MLNFFLQFQSSSNFKIV